MADAPCIVILGGGGHAKVLLDAIRLSGETREIAVLDADPNRVGQRLLDAPIVGTDARLAELARAGTRLFAIGLAGARDSSLRTRLFAQASALGLEPLTVVHPRSVVSTWARIGAGCQIFAGAVVNAHAALAQHVIVNTGAIVEHDCRIDEHVHIATGARLAGGVAVEALAHVGAGAVVRQLIRIGRGAVVGAGAVVVKDVLPATVVAGVPAKEIGP